MSGPADREAPEKPEQAQKPPRPLKRNRLLETAARLDNDQTMLIRMLVLIARILARALARVRVEGLEHIPRTRRRDPRGQPHLQLRPGRGRRLDHRCAQAPPDPLAGQARAVRLAGHRLGGRERRRPPGRPRRRRRRGLPARDEDPRGGLRAARVPGGHAEPHRRAAGGEGRPGDARDAHRRADRPHRHQQHGRGLEEGPEAALAVPAPDGHVRIGAPFRVEDVVPDGTDRRAAKRLATTRDHGPDRRAPRPAPPRRLRRTPSGRTRSPEP